MTSLRQGFKLEKFSFYFSRPTDVQFDITNRCNLNCLYCYNKSNEFISQAEMTDSEILRVIEKIIKQLDPLIVTFSGGEPFIRKDLLFKCIKKLKHANIKTHINTNGLLLNKKIIAKLKELKIDKLSVNLENTNALKHDFIRGKKGAFNKLKINLALLKKIIGGKKISIATVVNKENLSDLYILAEFVKKNGFMELHLLDMIPTNNNEKSFLLDKHDWIHFFKIFKKILKTGIKIKPNHALLFFSQFRKKMILPFCMACRLKMVICANGNIVPCNYFKKQNYFCGNALIDNLKKVWDDSPIMKKFRYSLKGYETCSGCKYFEKCAGGCKAFSLNVFGNAFKPDPYCSIYGFKNVSQK